MSYKLLIEDPNGGQKIINIQFSGKYYDQSKVLWDERKDGIFPTDKEEDAPYLSRNGDLLEIDTAKKTAHEEKVNLKMSVKYRSDRKKEYEKRGLNFDKFIEALIEDDVAEIAKFRSERQIVKDLFPKP